MIDIEEIALLDTQVGTLGSIGADAAGDMMAADLLEYLISVAVYTGQ